MFKSATAIEIKAGVTRRRQNYLIRFYIFNSV